MSDNEVVAIYVAIGIVGFFFYFIPSIVAYFRKQKNVLSIFVMNFFLGWMVIGWVIALVWALREDQRNLNVSAPE
ncbi:hypothetical protein LptCag_1474 [Leptospirillum ferriphilum]|uniref:Superinfection immunity protein n=1 Tax=Leptospirillum ferriphilum TaxID=178606 RepID=A0A094X5D2_9BACT|nr:superinfection immunity protein [Leptospirillum ferriphilum]KGA93764.1 hypothetical protein LptCag_1474 [Leptospirillum ferriphilum]